MCSALTPDCGYDKSTIILIGDVFCPKTKCLGEVCLHKKTFQSLGRSDYHNARICVRCAILLLKISNKFLFLSFGQRVYVFEETPKTIQDVIGDVYCPGKFCSNREKCESLVGYVTTPRSIYGCGKCGAWLFDHKVPFTLKEHVKTKKTDKTRFFSLKKDELGTQQAIVT